MVSISGDVNSGVYVLVVRLAHAQHITVGAMGRKSFPAGWYFYTGSAKHGIRQRIQRHFRREKPHRWHIDYLTTAEAARPNGAVIVPDDRLPECALNRLVGHMVGNHVHVPGFGASDCQTGCPAHLWYSRKSIKPSNTAKLIGGSAFCMGGEQTRRAMQGQ